MDDKNNKINIAPLFFTAIAITVIFILGSLVFNIFYKPSFLGNMPETTSESEFIYDQQKEELNRKPEPDFEIVADNLEIPWEIVFLPEGDILVTERVGNLRQIGTNSKIYNIKEVNHFGEGGLLGMALHPRFLENHWVYLYFTTKTEDILKNIVVRYKLENNQISDEKIIIDNIPASLNHNGGRIVFGPDNNLYIATGDAGNPNLSQDVNSLAGKILRVKEDGSIPQDNPFNNAVWSYGHRNPQGLAFNNNSSRLWATEHGPDANDELNLIEKGKNYGWPEIIGNQTKEGMTAPVVYSGDNETWAPSGAVFFNDSIFFGGLSGEALYEAKIEGDKVALITHYFKNNFGRIRAVVLGPDNFIYISTSNRDGRTDPQKADDKIIRINPNSILD